VLVPIILFLIDHLNQCIFECLVKPFCQPICLGVICTGDSVVNTCELQQVITYLQCSIPSEYTSACKVNGLLLFCMLEEVLLDLPDCRILSPDLIW